MPMNLRKHIVKALWSLNPQKSAMSRIGVSVSDSIWQARKTQTMVAKRCGVIPKALWNRRLSCRTDTLEIFAISSLVGAFPVCPQMRPTALLSRGSQSSGRRKLPLWSEPQ